MSTNRPGELPRLFDLVCDMPTEHRRARLHAEGADAATIAEIEALVASQVSMAPFAIAALIYWVFNFVVEMLLGAAEKKLDYYHD